MKGLVRIVSPRNASLALFGIAIVLVLATVVLSLVPPPPGKANTGAPIWLIWAGLIVLFGLGLRFGGRVLWAVTALISVPAIYWSLPADFGDRPTWVDYVTNGLAVVVALASAFACVSAVVALLTSRRATRVSIE